MARIALVLVSILALPAVGFASNHDSSLLMPSTAAVAAVAAAETEPAPAPVASEGNTMWPARQVRIKGGEFEQRRPLALPALYASLGVLNAMDIYTTSQALKNGAREANPAMASVAGNSGAAIAFKAATTASTIFFTERLWKKNRVAAIVTVAAINGVTAAVVAHNARNARR